MTLVFIVAMALDESSDLRKDQQSFLYKFALLLSKVAVRSLQSSHKDK